MDRKLSAASDEELVATLATQRSEEASAELFRRYRQKIYLWCFCHTHDVEDALDCTQEIFIRIFRNADRFAGRSRFSTWVYRITRNHCLAELSRKRDLWRRRSVPIEDYEEADLSFLDSLALREETEDLERLLSAAGERMKEEELEAFVLHYRDGLTVREVTRVLGCENVTGARTLIQNARRKFHRLVRREGFLDD